MVDLRKLYRLDDERLQTVEAAEGSVGLDAEARVALFQSLQERLDAVWETLDEAERARRIHLSESLDQGPKPWWRGLRPEARP